MQRALASVLATSVLLASALAHADVGPAPSCPAGEHSEYLYGRHCVPDGSHLERDPNGNVITVRNGAPSPTPTPSPSPIEFATPPPTPLPTATPTEMPESRPPDTREQYALPTAEPAQRGCACGIPGRPEQRVGFGLVVMTLLFAVGRRIRLQRSRR